MKTERRKNPKGTVLFTVVSVLAIMIIFMTCTLAMAAATNKRARKTYSSSQSSYTARTAIDSILAALGTDKNFLKAFNDLSEGQELDVVVELNNPSMGTISNAKIKYTGKKKVFDPDKSVSTWVERSLYTITADITIGGETTTITSSILQDPPEPPGDSTGGAAFLTYGSGLDVGNFTGSWGGTYLGMGEWTKGAITDNWRNQLQYNSWASGDPGVYGDGKMTLLAERQYLTNNNYHYQNDNSVEAPLVVNGNFRITNQLTVNYTYQAYGKENAGVQIWGDLDMGNNKLFFQATDNYRAQVRENGYEFLSMPYIYVDGTIKAPAGYGDGMYLGKKNNNSDKFDMALNVFCGNIESTSNNTTINADVYCMDAKGTSLFIENGSNLYGWSKTIVNGGNSFSATGGDFYSKGNVEIAGGNHYFAGDVRIEGDLTINSNVTIDGQLVVGGTINVKNGNLTVKGGIGDHTGIYTDRAMGGSFSSDKKEKDNIELVEGPKAVMGRNVDGKNFAWMDPAAIAEMNPKPAKETYSKDGESVDCYNFNWDGKYSVPKSAIIADAGWEPNGDAVKNRPSIDKYIDKDTGLPVSESDRYEISNVKFNGKTVGSIDTYLAVHSEGIYPKRAEREVLMGVTWPIKGIEGHVIAKPDDVSFADLSKKIYNADSFKGNEITQSGMLIGVFEDRAITVKTTGEDIYILLQNVNFKCLTVKDGEGNEKPSNKAKIIVDESAGGRVYFILGGTVNSNYDFSQDTAKTKLLKNVYDWMEIFKLEDVNEAPGANEPAPITGSATPLTLSSTSKLTGSWGASNYNVPEVEDPLTGAKHRDIVVKAPATGDMWIILDNFKTDNNVRIVVDDTVGNGTVKFYIKGEVSLGSNSGIVAKSFMNALNENEYVNIIGHNAYKDQFLRDNSYPIYDPPKVEIYSEKAKGTGNNKIYPKLKFENGSFITGYINAKDLEVNLPTVKDLPNIVNKIIYDGKYLKNADPKVNRIGVVGMMDVRSCTAANNWLLLYVDNTDAKPVNVVDAEGKHTYAAVEYFAYTH